MATAPPAKGKGGFLTRKLGPLPMWAYLAAGSVLVYWFFFRRSSSSSTVPTTGSNASTPAAATDAGSTMGAIPSSAGTAGDTTGLAAGGVNPSDLLSSLGAQNANLISGLLQQEQDIAANAAAEVAAFQQQQPTAPGPLSTTTVASQPGGSNAPTFHYAPVAARTASFAKAAVKQTASARKAGVGGPYGGVVKVSTNPKTKVVTTHYASGRIVQQKPGHSAYVAKR